MIGSHNSNIDLAFYNDRVKEIIAASIIAEPFTYVPIKAGHMELVGGNALVFGKITEGYDVIAIDVEKEITYQNVSLANPIITLTVNIFGGNNGNYDIQPWNNAVQYYKDDLITYVTEDNNYYSQ